MLAKVNVSQVSSPAMQPESYLVPPLAARNMYSSSISYNQRTQSANVRRPELLQSAHDRLSGHKDKLRRKGTCCSSPSGLSAILRHKKEVQKNYSHIVIFPT